MGDFAEGVFLSEAPTPPRFLFRVSSNFVGSESGHIKLFPSQPHTVVLNLVTYNCSPRRHTLSVYTVYFDTGKRGRVEQREG
jgi:hypothetical protein